MFRHFVGGIAFVDEVPKLASGKIIRKLMREWAKVRSRYTGIGLTH